MADGMDLVTLREVVGQAVQGLTMYTHAQLDGVFESLGMPQSIEGSKSERVNHSFAAVPDTALLMLAEQILVGQHLQVEAATRNAIEDVIWTAQSVQEIPKRTRREIARDLDLADLVCDADRFSALLDRLWVLDDDPWDGWLSGGSGSLRSKIEQHVYRNPGDWSAEDLFERLGAFEVNDARFTRFIEGLVSADVIPDEPAQRRVVGTIDPHLRAVGAELRETGTDGGYPVFSVVSVQSAHTSRPKNLIFASRVKPDIRFRDAIDNIIEILGDEDDVLVYDRPIGGDGILWRDLQAWWKDTQQLPDDAEAKKSLYSRLIRSLPDNSPPQRNLYELYHQIYSGTVQDLPALLPEVWLHWDPKTVRARGPEALLTFRMDFLLLLPHGQRVVLEVDGAQHYSSSHGRPDGHRYAANMRADRDLKLSGYEVFRFGATELHNRQQAETLLQQFFADLFRRFHVSPSSLGHSTP